MVKAVVHHVNHDNEYSNPKHSTCKIQICITVRNMGASLTVSSMEAHLRPVTNNSSDLLGSISVKLASFLTVKFRTDSFVSCCKSPCATTGGACPCRQE